MTRNVSQTRRDMNTPGQTTVAASLFGPLVHSMPLGMAWPRLALSSNRFEPVKR
jgi:hypothetical protein